MCHGHFDKKKKVDSFNTNGIKIINLIWFNEEDRNLEFVASTGYMPVLNDSFDKIDSYTFQSDAYKALYCALADVKESCTFLSEPNMVGYWSKVYALNDHIRALQKSLDGKTADDIKALFEAVN